MDVLLRLQEEGILQFELTNDDIKVLIFVRVIAAASACDHMQETIMSAKSIQSLTCLLSF